MKRSLRSMLFLLLAVCTLTVTAFADMGPKEQLVVKVENAPQELYYLDLLQKTGHRPGTFKDTMLNAPLVTLLQDSVPNGWWACLAPAGLRLGCLRRIDRHPARGHDASHLWLFRAQSL